MKNFHFRLEKVLDLRKMTEEQAQKRMADAHTARALQEQKRDAAETALLTEERRLRSERTGKFKAGEALIGHRIGQQLRVQLHQQNEKLAHAEEVVGDRRRELAEASRQKKMLETLREKRLEDYVVEGIRLEQAVMDDEAGQRLARVREFNG
jgi:flagellar protein FliJ